MLVRIVDIGSNSIKASVYDVVSQTYRLVSKDKLPFSLGEEVFTHGSIGEDAQEKVAAFIQGLPAAAGGEKVHSTFLLATSAVRSARNAEPFARKLHQRTGHPVRMLSGEEESLLIHLGLANKAGGGAKEDGRPTLEVGRTIGGSGNIRATFGIPRLEVSESGLREGAIWWWSRNDNLPLPVESGSLPRIFPSRPAEADVDPADPGSGARPEAQRIPAA